ncbi:hypothetical protein BS78_K080300 [Paspalum vaginatum]|uniref:Uncharacterized protein n=1 Tax=Paspalum vaginatum TaxID=158149 RepID=A0A9W7XBW7_9POAL|nr:hypothetical protein BS78_K080300 [Paspalum vaginatum]
MGKGKVHPSPALPAAAGVGGGETTAEAVLMRFLPAAVLAAAASLGAEAKEVLAYLVLASLRSSAPPTPARAGEGKAAEGHPPALACGCFGCYTAYWSRWDGSPEAEREAIHRAIEEFEEHLAREEREGGAGGAKARRGRKKRAAAAAAAAKDAAKEKAAKGKGKSKGKEVAVEPLPPPALQLQPPADLPVPGEAPKAEGGAEYLTAEEREDASTSAAACEDGACSGEDEKRRRGWLSWRAWGLWGSH